MSNRVNLLEGDLLALEAAAATAAASTKPAAATATITESTASATTAATATEAAAAAATAATATTEAAAAAAAIVVASLSIVKTHLTTLDGLAVELLESLLGIVNGGEGDVSEALGATRLTG